MAVKKKSSSNEKTASHQEILSRLNKVKDAINAKAGEVICGTLEDEEIRKYLSVDFIPTPNLDLNVAMGGGFPKGRVTIVTGLSDSGKTSLVLEAIGNAMKNPEFIALWLEAENSLKLEMIEDQFGIDRNRFFFIKMSSIEGAEAVLDQCEALLKVGGIDLFCINSLRALVPKTELNKSITEDTVAMQARMNTKALKKFVPICAEYNTALVPIQHLTTLIGSMSRDPYGLGGGMFLKYSAAIIMDMRKKTLLDTDPIAKDEGMKIDISIKKNHVTPRVNPYVKVPHYVIFGFGTEKIFPLLRQAIAQGILTQSGAWISWPDKELKWGGKVKFREEMLSNPDLFNELLNVCGYSLESLSDEEIDILSKADAEEEPQEEDEVDE